LADPKDDPIVYTAVAGKADVLCTLDRHFQSPAVLDFLRTHGIRVLSDVELLRELLLTRLGSHSA
jgi:predicted nucleic acid-binding protein